MKRFFTMIISTLVAFSGVPAMPIQAEVYLETTELSSAAVPPAVHLSEYFAPYYFSNLIGNIGNNEKGSCSQVATAMLLSYYDTYWDDAVIPEFYDEAVSMSSNVFGWGNIQSPGVKRESDNGFSDNSTIAEIAPVYQALSETGYFHSYLVDLGIDSNFHSETSKTLGLSSSFGSTVMVARSI